MFTFVLDQYDFDSWVSHHHLSQRVGQHAELCAMVHPREIIYLSVFKLVSERVVPIGREGDCTHASASRYRSQARDDAVPLLLGKR